MNSTLKSYLKDLQPGDKILHNWHGPCDVTFVGDNYIGICTGDGQHAMFRKDVESFDAWSEEREEAWRLAMAEEVAEQKNAETVPWPESTFHIEPEASQHYMGAHWDAFFENGVDDLMQRLQNILETSNLTAGFGDTHTSPNQTPQNWQTGTHLAWPDATCGVIMSLATDAEQHRFCSVYPSWSYGSSQRLQLDDVLLWESGVEGQIVANFGGAELTFFDTLFLHNRSWYERGRDYIFSLAGIAYNARIAEDVEIPYAPNPDQIAWEKELARLRGEKEPEKRPNTISMKGAAFFVNIDEWDKDDYSFHGPIKQVTQFSDFLGQSGWVVQVTVLRESACDPEDFDLDIVVTALAWDSETPPEVGQDLEGRLWLQGYLQDAL